MEKVCRIFAAALLTFTLTVAAFAGQMDTPPAPSTDGQMATPPAPTSNTSASDTTVDTTTTEVILIVIETLPTL